MGWSDRRYHSETTFRKRSGFEGTYALIAINIAVYILVMMLVPMSAVSSGVLADWFYVSGEGLQRGRLWQLLSYQFFHGGIWHLLSNMALFVLPFGKVLESLVGTRRFITWYLIAGAVGGLGCFLLPSLSVPTLGASGSAMGIMAALLYLIPNREFAFFNFSLKLKWWVAILVGIDIYLLLGSVRTGGGSTGTAHWTHLLGAVGGFLTAWIVPGLLAPLRRKRVEKTTLKAVTQDRVQRVSEAEELDRILDKINQVGLANLTPAERSFLQDASSRLQNSRRS